MHPPYAVHPSVEGEDRPLVVKKEGPGGPEERRDWLPATNTRIDFGFALKDTKAKGRLIDTGGFKRKDRITHRIPIASVDEIDSEVERWLKKAYEKDA